MNNPFSESERLKKIGYEIQLLNEEKYKIIVKLGEQNYYNLDSTHLSLLDNLKKVDDEIRNLKSDRDYIRGTQTSDTVQNVFNKIDKIFS
jgi:hypothetical protein